MSLIVSDPHWSDDLVDFVKGDHILITDHPRLEELQLPEWILYHHGIMTSDCKWWCHVCPQRMEFIFYLTDDMRNYIWTTNPAVLYSKKEYVELPTARGFLINIGNVLATDFVSSINVGMNGFVSHKQLNILTNGTRREAGKVAEEVVLDFIRSVWDKGAYKSDKKDDINGIDIYTRFGSGQIKCDSRARTGNGNIFVQTHTNNKNGWHGALVNQ